jgi:YD repeat-containing protein
MISQLRRVHVREKVMRSSTGEVFQDNHLSYDTLGRLIDSADNRAHITFTYDKADNRTRVTTYVDTTWHARLRTRPRS